MLDVKLGRLETELGTALGGERTYGEVVCSEAYEGAVARG